MQVQNASRTAVPRCATQLSGYYTVRKVAKRVRLRARPALRTRLIAPVSGMTEDTARDSDPMAPLRCAMRRKKSATKSNPLQMNEFASINEFPKNSVIRSVLRAKLPGARYAPAWPMLRARTGGWLPPVTPAADSLFPNRAGPLSPLLLGCQPGSCCPCKSPVEWFASPSERALSVSRSRVHNPWSKAGPCLWREFLQQYRRSSMYQKVPRPRCQSAAFTFSKNGVFVQQSIGAVSSVATEEARSAPASER